MTILRNILGALLGLLIGGFVNMGIIMAGNALIPPPAGVDFTNVENLRQTAHLLQPIHFLTPFLGHAVGTLVGALVAVLVAASHFKIVAGFIGVFFLIGGIAAAMMIPGPAWFIAVDLIFAYLPMAWIGMKIARR
jgi:hypothetical protein